MTYDVQRTTVEAGGLEPAPVAGRGLPSERTAERITAQYRPSGSTLASRVVIVIFGIMQALLLARILLLVLDARRGNDLVAAILGASQLLVAPFEGMFRTDALSAGGAVVDIAAVTALVALTIVELVILAIVRIPRRSEAV